MINHLVTPSWYPLPDLTIKTFVWPWYTGKGLYIYIYTRVVTVLLSLSLLQVEWWVTAGVS